MATQNFRVKNGLEVGTGVTITSGGNITAGIITASSAFFSGNVSIAGTLTYEDVTNVDAIGLVTARTGVRITSGGLVVASGIATFGNQIHIFNSSPSLKLQDSDGTEQWSNLNFDGSSAGFLNLDLRQFLNTPSFRIRSFAGGTDTATFLTVQGGSTSGSTFGFIGINSTSPTARLDVVGDARVTGGIQVTSGVSTFAGITTVTGPTLFTNQLSVSGVSTSSIVNDSKGDVRILPANSQTSSYILVASDSGKHINITTGGVTVPASVFNVGDVVTIFNNSANNQTITQGSVTLRQAGTANTGNRTLAQYGLATILCVASNTFVISGAGLS